MPSFPSWGSACYGQAPLYTRTTTSRRFEATQHAPDFLNPCYSNSFVQPNPPQRGFSPWRAAKETIKGALRPITTILKHPFKSAFAIGATVAVAAVAPVTVPLMVLAGLGLGGIQVARGVGSALKNAWQGNYRAAEKAFGDIGEGGFSIATSLFGVRQAGSIAAEAKASNTALSATASATEKLNAVEDGLKAAQQVQSGSWQAAFQETLSLVTSSSGRRATAAQLNPARVASVAKGKFQALLARFTQSPAVKLDSAVQDTQASLKLSQTELPYAEPAYLDNAESIPFAELADTTAGVFQTESQSIYARQFLGVDKLSIEEAGQLIRNYYPQWSAGAVKQFLAQFAFKGQGVQTARHPVGEQNLLKFAQYYAQRTAVENPYNVTPFGLQQPVRNAFRAPEAYPETYQLADEALPAPRFSAYREPVTLAASRGARIEAKINQLLAKFDHLERKGAIPQTLDEAASLGTRLVNSAKSRQPGLTTTASYLQQEQFWSSATETPRPHCPAPQPGIFTTIKNAVTGFISRIVQFFTPASLQQC